MSEKKNIDRLFQEKFKDFEANPPEFIWDNIREELQEKKKRRVIPIWIRLSGTAAVLLFGLLLGFYFYEGNGNNPIVIGNPNAQPQQAPLKTLPTDAPTPGANLNKDKVYDRSDSPVTDGSVVTNDKDNESGSGTDTGNGSASGSNNLPNGKSKIASPASNNAVVTNNRNNKNAGRGTKGSKNQNALSKQENAVVNNTNANKRNTAVSPSDKNNTAAQRSSLTNKNNAVATTGTGKNKSNGNTANGSVTNADKINAQPRNAVANNNAATSSSSDKNNTGSLNENALAGTSGNNQPETVKNNGTGKAPANANLLNNGSANNNSAVAVTNANKTAQDNNTLNNGNAAEGQAPATTINKDIPLPETAVAATDTVKPENELEKLLREKEEGKKDEKEKALAANTKTNKWNVKPQMAPVFYNSLSQGSPIDGQFAGNSKSYENDLSYGLGVNYAVNDRIKIRSGINTVNLNYKTQGVEFYASLNNQTSNVAARSANANIVVQSQGATPGSVVPNAFFADNASADTYNGSMLQKTGYVEVPVEMAYSLLNNKFGIDIIGGVSTLFLNQNNVSVISDQGYSTNVGKAENLNNIHFSTNIGVGFKYRFFKSFEANFEPMFKYQVSTFSRDAGNFKPYFIGLYSGISFSF